MSDVARCELCGGTGGFNGKPEMGLAYKCAACNGTGLVPAVCDSNVARCELCGEPMPPGEEMFKFHGYSGNCPKPPLPSKTVTPDMAAARFCREHLEEFIKPGIPAKVLKALSQLVEEERKRGVS